MVANPKRVLQKNFWTKDEQIEFKFYDTGSLSARFADAGTTRNGADKTFARINNLNTPELAKFVPKFAKLLEKIAHRSMDVTVEYVDSMNHDLLERIFSDRKSDPMFLWATFVAGVSDTRELTADEIFELAEKNKDELGRVVDMNAYRYFLRPDLGYFSQYERMKTNGMEDTVRRHDEIRKMMANPISQFSLKRVESGVETARIHMLLNPAALPYSYYSVLAGASLLITHEEARDLNELMTKNQISNLRLQRDVSLLLGYTYVTLGVDRTKELLHFLVKYSDQEYYWREIGFNELKHPQGVVNFDLMARVVESLKEDTTTPLDWILEMEI